MPASPVLISCPPANEADDHRPIPMPVQAGDQELWLGAVEVRQALLPLHEVRGLLLVPGALRLAKDRDTIDGRTGVLDAFVAEVVNGLNE